MAQSIKLNNALYWDSSAVHTQVVTAAWAATSSTASLTTLTEEVVLDMGTWLCIGRTPISDTSNLVYTLRSISGSTSLGTNNYFTNGGNSYIPILAIFKVGANASVVLRSASSQAVNFTYPERGGLTFIKLSNYS